MLFSVQATQIPYFANKKLSFVHCAKLGKNIFIIDGAKLMVFDAKSLNKIQDIEHKMDLHKLKVIKDNLYVLDHGYQIHKFGKNTQKWQHFKTAGAVQDVDAKGGIIYGLTHQGQVFAMKKNTLLWKTPQTHSSLIQGSILCVEPSDASKHYGVIITSLKKDIISIIDARSGSVLSEHLLPYNSFYKIVQNNNRIFCVSDKGWFEFNNHFESKSRQMFQEDDIVMGVTDNMVFFTPNKVFVINKDQNYQTLFKAADTEKIENAYIKSNLLVIITNKNTILFKSHNAQRLPADTFVIDSNTVIYKNECRLKLEKC